MDVRIDTAPEFALIPKVLLHWILTKSLNKHKLCPFLEQELVSFDRGMSCHIYIPVCLPGEKHSASGILCEVPWSVLSTLFPKPPVLQEVNQEMETETRNI